MTSVCGSHDAEEWGGLGGWILEEDNLPPSLEACMNQGLNRSNVPSQLEKRNLESSAPAMLAQASEWRPISSGCLLRPKDITRLRRQVADSDVLFTDHKRPRSPDWSAEEKRAYLELKVEALRVVKGKDWDFISQGLWERHEFDRNSKVCEYLWGTLRKDFKAIRDHEISKSGPPTTSEYWVSYWDMDEDERFQKKLPRSFPLEWCKMIERILSAQENRSGKRSRVSIPAPEPPRDEDNEQCFPYLHQAQSFGDGPGDRSHMTSDQVEITSPNSNTCREEYPQVEEHVVEAVNSALHRLGYRKRLEEEDDLTTRLSKLVKQQVEDVVNSTSFFASIVEENQLATLAPLLKYMIKDAVHCALEPTVVSSALQTGQDQDELQEYREKLQALAEKRRALDLDELQLKCQLVAGHQRKQRPCSSSKQRQAGLRARNAFKEARVFPP
jgi:hypothetical protein